MKSLFRTLALTAMTMFLLAGAAVAIELIEDHQDIEGPFTDGPSVTAACIECHDDVAHDFMQTSHWTWEPMQDVIGKGQVPLGKKNTLNNFCIAVDSNWPRCTSCHAGYGWKDATFDFTNEENIDCLICHDQTGTYKKFPTGAGHPVYEPKEWQGKIWEPLDLASLARTAGAPGRDNCGACHYSGGGGNNVKHGDMEKALSKPEFALDVHMSAEGQNFSCQECHTTTNHDIQGNAMFVSPGGANHLECTSCHEDEFHDKRILNWHAKSVACQTCHVPTFARANPTKMWWDWSTAGTKTENVKDEFGKNTFVKKKGTFKWEKNVVPTYSWYNGVSGQYLLGDTMNPNEVTKLNWPTGNNLDPKAKIYPFKVMRGKQVYDKKLNTILVPKLFGKTGFWKNGFDWNNALEQGSKSVSQEYSGEYDFAETESYWKINHMVAPATDALKCKDCHAKDGTSRMDWQALGYDGDPSKKRGLSRYELKDAYNDVNLD
ncbi:MAG: tetrathionate reductase family octaheme c-type cytochrome [Candidatus Krumholzibacteria bacterium]|nr:tetrathionate reductase family octaheme c-type cytochrome [Candidatus Krumholzibacteria bacterium]